MAVSFSNLTDVIGAEAHGVDMAAPLDAADRKALRETWLDRTILLLRNQAHVTPAEHVRFSKNFGELEGHTLPQFTLESHPEIFVVSNAVKNGKPVGARRAGWHWHSDSQFLKVPSAGSLLLARDVPPSDGDTLFANMYAAYDGLSAAMKARIEGLRILVSRVRAWPISYPHRPPLTDAEKAKLPDVVHPLVRTHPETGRKSLYIGGNVVWSIVGMDDDEARDLLDELRAHATSDEYVYRHKWQPGDAIMWDNRSSLHCATAFDEEKYVRVMHRTTLIGSVPA